MKILLIGDFSFGTLGLSYCNAFKKLNCEVYKFDTVKSYNEINPFVKYGLADRLFSRIFVQDINKAILQSVVLHKPDIVFVIKGSIVFPDTLKKIKSLNKGLLINFNPDNPFNPNKGASNDFIRKSIPLYDCYFIWGKFLMPLLKNAGAKHVEYLPFAYDPELHYPVKISDEEKKIFGSDIAFIGSWDKEREYWLSKITDYDLAIWGNAWEKLSIFSPLRKKWKGRAVIGEDFSKVCNASKIVLNLIRKQNENAHNMRTFEVPACKGFMLTTRTSEQSVFFEEGKDMVCFETPDELIKKINEYLFKNEDRKKTSEEAYKKVQPHVYMERAKAILDVCSRISSKN